MLDTLQIVEIKQMYAKRYKLREIAETVGVSISTVSRVVKGTQYKNEVGVPQTRHRTRKAQKYERLIADILMEYSSRRGKRSIATATMIYYDMLTPEQRNEISLRTFQREYRMVAEAIIPERYSGSRTTREHLIPDLGKAQADFGLMPVTINDVLVNVHAFILSFPYSNARFAHVVPSESIECVVECMNSLFSFLGGVPPVIRFDNASALVTLKKDLVKLKTGGDSESTVETSYSGVFVSPSPEKSKRRTIEIIDANGKTRFLTEGFNALIAHYGFAPEFCNGAAGWEKGHVERSVGFIRQRCFGGHGIKVTGDTIDEVFSAINDKVYAWCENQLPITKSRTKKVTKDAFAEDMTKFLPLPEEPLVYSKTIRGKIDTYGCFTVDKHQYYTSLSKGTSIYIEKKWNKLIYYTDTTKQDKVEVARGYNLPEIHYNWAFMCNRVQSKLIALRNVALLNDASEELKDFIVISLDNDAKITLLKMMERMFKNKATRESVVALLERCLVAFKKPNHKGSFTSLFARMAFGTVSDEDNDNSQLSEYGALSEYNSYRE